MWQSTPSTRSSGVDDPCYRAGSSLSRGSLPQKGSLAAELKSTGRLDQHNRHTAALTRMALPDSLPATREAWHRLAEHVLAAAQYAATDHIGLVPAPGGFASPSKIDRARSQHPTERGAHHRLADRADTDVQHWAVSGVHPGSSYLASEPIRPPQRLMPHRASR